MNIKTTLEAIEGLCRTIAKVARYIMGIRIETVAKVGFAMVVGGILFDILITHVDSPIEYARAEEVVEEVKPKEVMIRVEVDWTKERIEKEIRDTFPEAPETMVRVAKCESSLIATAKGPTNDHGIFQLHMPSHSKQIAKQEIDVSDPADNIRFARYLYDQSGLQPWSASKHCWQK